MSKKVIIFFVSLIMGFGVFCGVPSRVDAGVANEFDMLSTTEIVGVPVANPDVSILVRTDVNHEGTDIQPYGVGYKWKCYTCGYVSALHVVASTAITKANAHAVTYRHKTTVFNA